MKEGGQHLPQGRQNGDASVPDSPSVPDSSLPVHLENTLDAAYLEDTVFLEHSL
jgi:hypothetical protein